MGHQNRNRYCTRCGKTTLFWMEGAIFTCTGCGVRVDTAQQPVESRSLIGDPFHQFRIRSG